MAVTHRYGVARGDAWRATPCRLTRLVAQLARKRAAAVSCASATVSVLLIAALIITQRYDTSLLERVSLVAKINCFATSETGA
eukprot:6199630-Pleurochrysis_carterae.AAC.1